MGLLRLIPDAANPTRYLPEKSFGMFGSGQSCIKGNPDSDANKGCDQYATEKAAAIDGATYFNAQAQGYLSNTAQMSDSTSTDKYMIVSLWANAWDSTWSSTIKKDAAGLDIGSGKTCTDGTKQISSMLTTQTLQ